MQLLSSSRFAELKGLTTASVLERVENNSLVHIALPGAKNKKIFIPLELADFNPKKHKSSGCQTLVMTNLKGGVGKTTSSTNLAAALSLLKKRALLVDMDPQANATHAFFSRSEIRCTMNDILNSFIEKKPMSANDIKNCIITKQFNNTSISILPSTISLSRTAEQLRFATSLAISRLDNILDKVRDDYDYIIIDTPPNASLIMQMSLYAADSVIILVEPEEFAVEGMSVLIDEINAVKADIADSKGGKSLELFAFVINKIQNIKIHSAYIKELEGMAEELGVKKVYQIPLSTKIKEGQYSRLPIYEYKDELTSGFTVGGPILQLASDMVRR
jgi:chromosome partitioning protein